MELEFRLCRAAKRGDETKVRQLLAEGARVDQVVEGWLLPLDQAARKGHEAVVRLLLAAGARADQARDWQGWLPLHAAALGGHVRVAKLLLEINPATALAASSLGRTPLHQAAGARRVEVVKLLLEVAPAAATMLDERKNAPIHMAAYSCNAAIVQLLFEAAPKLAYAPNADGHTPLHLTLPNKYQHSAEQVEKTARCLVQAAPAVQPTLGILIRWCNILPFCATLFADLVARLPLSQEQWQSIPAPCPDLARALPAVLERSTAEAGWLVGRLAGGQRAWLRMTLLCMARVQQESGAVLPAELSRRILALCLL